VVLENRQALQNGRLARIEESFPCLKTEKSASKLEADLNLPLIRKSASKLGRASKPSNPKFSTTQKARFLFRMMF
jgi:hypothetical protein